MCVCQGCSIYFRLDLFISRFLFQPGVKRLDQYSICNSTRPVSPDRCIDHSGRSCTLVPLVASNRIIHLLYLINCHSVKNNRTRGGNDLSESTSWPNDTRQRQSTVEKKNLLYVQFYDSHYIYFSERNTAHQSLHQHRMSLEGHINQ